MINLREIFDAVGLTEYLANRAVTPQCILDCRATRAEWLFDSNVIWENGVYVAKSCMKRCVDVAVKAFDIKTSRIPYRQALAKIKAIALEETSPTATYLQIATVATVVAVAATTIYYLCPRKKIHL